MKVTNFSSDCEGDLEIGHTVCIITITNLTENSGVNPVVDECITYPSLFLALDAAKDKTYILHVRKLNRYTVEGTNMKRR